MTDTPDYRVLIAMPVGSSCMADTRTVQWADRYNYCHPDHYRFMWSASDACARGRNTLIEIAQALDHDIPAMTGWNQGPEIKRWPVTHIQTLDSDMVCQRDMIERLLAHDKAIVAGCYPMRVQGAHMWSFQRDHKWWNGKDPRTAFIDEPTYPLIEVDTLGGGGVLSKREVFDSMAWPWHKMVYKPMDENGSTIEISEDVWFCKEAMARGFKLYVDVTCTCDHFKRVALP